MKAQRLGPSRCAALQLTPRAGGWGGGGGVPGCTGQGRACLLQNPPERSHAWLEGDTACPHRHEQKE